MHKYRPGYVYKLHPPTSRHWMKTTSGWTPQQGGSPEQNKKETDQEQEEY